MRRNSIGF